MEVQFEPIWYEDYPGLAQRCDQENGPFSLFCQELYMDDEVAAKKCFDYLTDRIITPANTYHNNHSKGSWSWLCEMLYKHSGERPDPTKIYFYPKKPLHFRNNRLGVSIRSDGDNYYEHFDGSEPQPLTVRRDYLTALDWSLIKDSVPSS